MRVTAIVLAAGESRRMGRTKQTLPYGDSTIIEAIVDALERSRVDQIVVVLGANREEIAPLLANRRVHLVTNPHSVDGMLSSAQCALNSLLEGDDAYLFVLGDQPQIDPAIIDSLIATAERSQNAIFLPVYQGRRGHPVLIRAALRAAILALPLTVGLNELIHRNADTVEEVPVQTPSVLKDIDTPEDYQEAIHGS